MSKCGKGCMPECEYFITGGCISPFNCSYKIEEISPNSATSVSDTFVQCLIAENAALRERLEKAVELPCIEPMTTWDWDNETGIGESHFGDRYQLLYRDKDGEFIAYVGLDKEEAEARLAELKGGKK